jgi:hypothetical protein
MAENIFNKLDGKETCRPHRMTARMQFFGGTEKIIRDKELAPAIQR